MTKEQFLAKWEWHSKILIADFEAVIEHEIAKVKEQEPQPALNPIEQAYHNGVKIREVNLHKPKWIKKHTITQAVDDTGHYWDFIEDLDFTTHPEKWELYTEPTEQVAELTEQPKMTEKEKIDHILTNKLTWKPIGSNKLYANWFSAKASDGSRKVYFVDYNNPHSGYFETRIFNIDLSEWQPVEAAQPSSQAKLDNSFDKERFEAMFRAVVASGRTERWEQDFKFTEEALAKLDAYYAEKGGNNG